MDIHISCVLHTLKKHEMLIILWINSIDICLLICHRYTMCEYFMESLNCPLCFGILRSLFFCQICWLQLATYFFYFFGPTGCQSHAAKMVKKGLQLFLQTHMLLVVLPLNLSEKIIQDYVSDEKESTQLQISSDPLEYLSQHLQKYLLA